MSDQEFLERIRQTLDDSAETLDEATTSRLRSARRQAISQGAARQRRAPIMGGLAAVASVLVALALWLEEPEQATLPPLLDDMELLSTTEDLEFYENLEFFYWLEEGQEAG